MAERHDIDHFVGIDAGSGIGGQVADIVGSRAAGVETDALDPSENFRRVLGLESTALQVCSRGDLHVTGGQVFGDAGQFAQLKASELTRRNSQPRHERFFVGREVKQSIPLEAETLTR